MRKRAIVYTVDDNLECLLQIVSSMKSVKRFCKEPIDIYLLTNSPRSWMRDLYDSKVVDISKLVDEYGLGKTGIVWRKNPVPPMLLARLLIPLVQELSGYDQILYLDCDTEVWSSRFTELFDADDTCEIIGVRDSLTKAGARRRISRDRIRGGSDWKDPQWVFNRWEELISGDGKYANSGVLVFNLKNIKDGYGDRIRYILGKVAELKPYYSDQDAINVYFRIFVIDDRRFNAWGADSGSAIIRHYVGNERRYHAEYPFVSDSRPNEDIDGSKRNPVLGMFSGIADHVYVLTNEDNPSNFEMLSEWLTSNGVSEFSKIYTDDEDLYGRLLSVSPCDRGMKPEHMANWIGHYKAIVDAMKAGYDKIVVLEDGFQPNGLENAIKNLKSDFDVAVCTGGGQFARTYDVRASSTKGYILGTRCMVDFRRLFESLWRMDSKNLRIRYMYKWFDSSILVKERAIVRKN